MRFDFCGEIGFLILDKKDNLNYCKVLGILEGSLMIDLKFLELVIYMKKIVLWCFGLN